MTVKMRCEECKESKPLMEFIDYVVNDVVHFKDDCDSCEQGKETAE